jgi:hypothetical protein
MIDSVSKEWTLKVELMGVKLELRLSPLNNIHVASEGKDKDYSVIQSSSNLYEKAN